LGETSFDVRVILDEQSQRFGSALDTEHYTGEPC